MVNIPTENVVEKLFEALKEDRERTHATLTSLTGKVDTIMTQVAVLNDRKPSNTDWFARMLAIIGVASWWKH